MRTSRWRRAAGSPASVGNRQGPVALDTGSRGDALFTALEPGRYTMHVESDGFAPDDARDVRVRAGDNRREVKLVIAKVAETVDVGRDPRERASDPRSDAFATVLDQARSTSCPTIRTRWSRCCGTWLARGPLCG